MELSLAARGSLALVSQMMQVWSSSVGMEQHIGGLNHN